MVRPYSVVLGLLSAYDVHVLGGLLVPLDDVFLAIFHIQSCKNADLRHPLLGAGMLIDHEGLFLQRLFQDNRTVYEERYNFNDFLPLVVLRQ